MSNQKREYVNTIINQLKTKWRLDSDAELARRLRTNPRVVWSWRKKNTMPASTYSLMLELLKEETNVL